MIRTRRTARHRAPQRHRGLAGTAAAATAIVALVLTLTPSPGTQAQWYSEVRVTTPAATTDSLTLALTPTSATAATVTNGAAEQAVEWAPRTLTVAPGPSTTAAEVGTFLQNTRVGYAGGQACTAPAAAWTAAPVTSGTAATIAPNTGSPARASLAAGANGQLCLDVRPGLTGAALARVLAGRTVTLTTTADSRSVAPATWTSPAATWTTAYRVDLPRPDLQCSSGTFAATRLSWSWAGTAAGATPAINRWEIWTQDGRTRLLTVAGDARSVQLQNGDLSVLTWSTSDIVLRAYPFANSTAYYADSTRVIEVRRNWLSQPDCLSSSPHNPTNPVVLP